MFIRIKRRKKNIKQIEITMCLLFLFVVDSNHYFLMHTFNFTISLKKNGTTTTQRGAIALIYNFYASILCTQ